MSDVAIVGSGPVGIFGVFACGMVGLSCDVFDVLPQIGGQCSTLYPHKPIYDIPAHPKINGGDLIEQLLIQATPFKPNYNLGGQVIKMIKNADQTFTITTDKNVTSTVKAVIIAAGCGAFGPNRPPLNNLEQYEITKCIHYHVGDPNDFTGKVIAIAGGGDSALDWTLALSNFAQHINLIHRRSRFRGSPESVKRLENLIAAGKVSLHTPYQLSALNGDNGKLSSVVITTMDGNDKTVPSDDLLLFFGLSMDLGPINDWGLALDKSTITINPANGSTNIDGIFAAGDIVGYDGKLKLILTGFAEISRAAHSAYNFINPNQPLHFEYSTSKFAS